MTAIKSVAWIWSGSIVSAATAFFVNVILARVLGVESYGVFTSSLAVITTLSPLAAFGVSSFVVKAFAKEGSIAERWVTPVLRFSLASTVAIMAVGVLWALVISQTNLERDIILILALLIPSQAMLELIICKHQLEDDFSRMGLAQALPGLMRAIAVVVAGYLSVEYGFVTLCISAVAYVVPNILILIIGALYLLNFSKYGLKPKGFENIDSTRLILDENSVKNTFFLSAPFGFGVLLHLVYYQSGIIFLGNMHSHEAAANFSIVISILTAVYMLPSILFQRFVQKIFHIEAYGDAKRFFYRVKRSVFFAGFIGCVAAIISVAIIPVFIKIVFGDGYIKASEVFWLVAISIPLRFMSFSTGAALQTRDYAGIKVRCMGVIALISVLLSFVLVPWLGLEGAALVLLMSEFMLFTVYTYFVCKFFGNK